MELGALMKELGAHNALNLDAGGSSAMWIRGKGVVNSPSDGSERVTGNHLAVIASGSGAAGSCDPTMDEIIRTAAVRGGGRLAQARARGLTHCFLSTPYLIRSGNVLISTPASA